MQSSFTRWLSRRDRPDSHRSVRRRRELFTRAGGRASGGRLGLESLEGRAVPAVITVTSLLDTIANDGQITLREAILAAELDASIDGSTKGSGADTIKFSPALTGTISLGGSQLSTATNVSIVGPGNDRLTIDARGQSRVLAINGGTFVMSGLTLAGGSADEGAGVRVGSSATAEFDGCVIRDNTAVNYGGGVYSEGTLTVKYSQIVSNSTTNDLYPIGQDIPYSFGGGGVFSAGALVIEGSNIDYNSGEHGGGIATYGTSCTIATSTVSGNHSQSNYGGGLTAQTAFTAKATTFMGNTGGGAIAAFSDATLDSCAIIGNSNDADFYGMGGGLTLVGTSPADATASVSVPLATITRCTLSGNEVIAGYTASHLVTDLSGAAIALSNFRMSIQSSTICDNRNGPSAVAIYGTWDRDLAGVQKPLFAITSSVVGRNAGGNFDVRFDYISNYILDGTPTVSADPLPINANASLIQRPALGTLRGRNNIVGVDPQLGPLADNGGPTLSYMPLPNSPVINRGVTTTTFDQRGVGYVGACGKADMGAIEVQKAGAYLLPNGLGRQLVVAGSAIADTIIINRTSNAKGASFFNVTINGQKTSFATSTISAITVMGYAGNDKLTIDASVTIDCVVDGGNDDDSITGGAGADVLLGSDGNDTIAGGDGMDLVIGGDGHDVLSGGLAKDIVIGGETALDRTIDQLTKIRILWKSAASLDDRVTALLTGAGGAPMLPDSAVSDNFYDLLTLDAAGMELYYASDEDDVVASSGNRKIRVFG